MLFTQLNLALQSEDYAKAARLRDALRRSQGSEDPTLLDWHEYGIPEWLCQRAEQLGWRFPTGVLQSNIFCDIVCNDIYHTEQSKLAHTMHTIYEHVGFAKFLSAALRQF